MWARVYIAKFGWTKRDHWVKDGNQQTLCGMRITQFTPEEDIRRRGHCTPCNLALLKRSK